MTDDRELRFRVTAEQAGRADRAVASQFPDAGRRRIARLFADGAVRIDGRVASKGQRVAAGDEIVLARAPATAADLVVVADDSPAVELLYADDWLVAMAVPAGVPAHPLRAGETGCAANWLVARFADAAGVGDDPREAGLVHRLDTDTTGVLLAARDRDTWRALRAAFSEGRVQKQYLALVAGTPGDGSVHAPLAQRGRRAVVDYGDGLDAETEWRTIARAGDYALLDCRARTGRTHQIRAHLAHVGAAIVGDALYGGPTADGLTGQFLHAARLELTHPATGEPLQLAAPLPAARRQLLERLGITPPG